MQIPSFASKSSSTKFSFCRNSDNNCNRPEQPNEGLQKHAQATINTPEYMEMLDLIQKSQVPGGIFSDKDQRRLNKLIEKFMYFDNDRSDVYVCQKSSCNHGDWKDKPPIREAINSEEVLEKLSNAKSPLDIIKLAQQDIEKCKHSHLFNEMHQLGEYWNIANQAGDIKLVDMIVVAMEQLRGDRPTSQHRTSPHALDNWGA